MGKVSLCPRRPATATKQRFRTFPGRAMEPLATWKCPMALRRLPLAKTLAVTKHWFRNPHQRLRSPLLTQN